jgi:hypothetical protein
MFCVQVTFWDSANPNHTQSALCADVDPFYGSTDSDTGHLTTYGPYVRPLTCANLRKRGNAMARTGGGMIV